MAVTYEPRRSLWERAVETVLAHEGAFVSDPRDPGGATNWGISLRFLRAQGADLGDVDGDGDIDAEDVRRLPQDVAVELYRREFWDRYLYGRLPEPVASKVFDLAVNMGPSSAHRCLQRACRACGFELVEDGVIGQETRRVCGSVSPPAALAAALRSEAAGFYRLLVARRPAFEAFETGWLNRAYS